MIFIKEDNDIYYYPDLYSYIKRLSNEMLFMHNKIQNCKQLDLQEIGYRVFGNHCLSVEDLELYIR